MFFKTDAYTSVLKADDLKYSEAFAGSGEFAIVRLVHEIRTADQKSLILLDEPEVSLHPGAQEKLMKFLLEEVKQKKHQIVISTHSPAMIRNLPPDAIKVFVCDPTSHRIMLPTQGAAPEEAFFHLGEPINNKLLIVVEDALAKSIVKKALRLGGEAFATKFEVKFFPGGSSTLWGRYIPIFAAEQRNRVLVLLDGDERPSVALPDPNDIPASGEKEIADALRKVAKTEIKFSTDGGIGGGNAAQECELRRKLIAWARINVDYLPGNSKPEQFLWDRMRSDSFSESMTKIVDAKKRFVALARSELGREKYEEVTSQEILATQERRLQTIDGEHSDIKSLYERLRKFGEEAPSESSGRND
jgi:hypothetical protein